ncbi:HNH endonuclease signature motif containing protein, partial [Glycomyces harbinensis]
MSTCTTTPDHSLTAPAAGSLLVPADSRSRAQALRSTLDAAASLINAQHAQVLSAVIAMNEANLHRSQFGFSALRDLLLSQFDFTFNTAGSIAAIARLARKFTVLARAATTGAARIDQVAYAVRQLDQTPAMRQFAKTPFRAPVASPFDPDVTCTTPEAMVSEYCAHASFKDLRRHLDELRAAIAEETELLDALGEQSLQRLELTEQGNGMWHLEGDLSDATGRLLDKYLKTACPPPRQDEQDAEGVLPPQANRHAEALHQLLAGYGTSPEAATRHGHTATLDLTVDVQTLQGQDTGRLPLLEGQPVSVAQARLLACEAGVVPSVFDYEEGEAVELGRALRLPNVALRRKLELEQPEGCIWTGCDRPVAWTEAHHITHWADGGLTNAANLILVCRFHHGRVHTTGWSVEKTGPGQALITHHDHPHAKRATASDGTGIKGVHGHSGTDNTECGCSDWRSDADMDAEHRDSDWDAFPTGLYRTEWSDTLTPDLDALDQEADRRQTLAAIKAARAKARERFAITTPDPEPQAAQGRRSRSEPALTATATAPGPGPSRSTDFGEPPFLPCPSRPLLGEAPHARRSPNPPRGIGPLTMP